MCILKSSLVFLLFTKDNHCISVISYSRQIRGMEICKNLSWKRFHQTWRERISGRVLFPRQPSLLLPAPAAAIRSWSLGVAASLTPPAGARGPAFLSRLPALTHSWRKACWLVEIHLPVHVSLTLYCEIKFFSGSSTSRHCPLVCCCSSTNPKTV